MRRTRGTESVRAAGGGRPRAGGVTTLRGHPEPRGGGGAEARRPRPCHGARAGCCSASRGASLPAAASARPRRREAAALCQAAGHAPPGPAALPAGAASATAPHGGGRREEPRRQLGGGGPGRAARSGGGGGREGGREGGGCTWASARPHRRGLLRRAGGCRLHGRGPGAARGVRVRHPIRAAMSIATVRSNRHCGAIAAAV